MNRFRFRINRSDDFYPHKIEIVQCNKTPWNGNVPTTPLLCVHNTGLREMFRRGFLYQRRGEKSSAGGGRVRGADQEQDSGPGGSPLSAVQDQPKPAVGPQPARWVWAKTLHAPFSFNLDGFNSSVTRRQIATVTWSLTRGLCGTWASWPPASSWWTNPRKTRCTTWLRWPTSPSWWVIQLITDHLKRSDSRVWCSKTIGPHQK